MNKQLSLKIVMGIAIAGMLFAGYLSLSELFMKVCPLGGCQELLGIPTCVYGFVMYLAVFIVSLLGILEKSL